MSWLMWLRSQGLSHSRSHPLVDFGTIEEKCAIPAHKELKSIISLSCVDYGPIALVECTILDRYELVIQTEYHGRLTYCSAKESFLDLWHNLAVGDRVEIDYSLGLLRDTIIDVRKA